MYRISAFCLALALVLSACDAQGPLSPSLDSHDAPASTLAPGASKTDWSSDWESEDPARDQYVVMFKGKKLPKNFDDDVAALGGSVIYAHEGIGFAYLGDLSEEAAAEVAAMKGVVDFQADATFELDAILD